MNFQPPEDALPQSEPGMPPPPMRNFIEIIHHPHSGITDPTIIPLDSNEIVPSTAAAEVPLEELQRPWAPFRTRADFEYTATAVAGGLSADIVDSQLNGINKSWSVGSMLTIDNSADMARSLAAAREYVVPVCISISSSIVFQED